MNKVKKELVFMAVEQDNNFHSKQKVTDWYWSEDELVFCTNKQTHETEHYTVEEFVRQMSNYFDGIDSNCDEIDFDGNTDSFVFKKKEG